MEMKLTLDAATEPWGVLVERVEVKDVRVPERLQKAMAAEAEAAREARAKVGGRVIIIQRRRHLPPYLHFSVSQVIAAEGEHKASRALRHAAEVIAECPAALQVNSESDRLQHPTILVPAALPADSKQHISGEQQHHHLPRAY